MQDQFTVNSELLQDMGGSPLGKKNQETNELKTNETKKQTCDNLLENTSRRNYH